MAIYPKNFSSDSSLSKKSKTKKKGSCKSSKKGGK